MVIWPNLRTVLFGTLQRPIKFVWSVHGYFVSTVLPKYEQGLDQPKSYVAEAYQQSYTWYLPIQIPVICKLCQTLFWQKKVSGRLAYIAQFRSVCQFDFFYSCSWVFRSDRESLNWCLTGNSLTDFVLHLFEKIFEKWKTCTA